MWAGPSVRAGIRSIFVALGAVVLASCGGGDIAADASRSAPISSALKDKKPGQEPAMAGLLAGSLLLLANSREEMHLRALTQLADGGYTAVWCLPCGTPTTLIAQRFDARGAVAGPQARIEVSNTSGQSYAGVGVMPDGTLMLAYGSRLVDLAADLVRNSLFTQRYGAAGDPIGAPVEVTFHVHSHFSAPTQITFAGASFVSWDDGAYAVAWGVLSTLTRSQAGPVSETYVQRYDAAGNPAGGPRQLSRHADGAGTHASLSLTALADGGYVVALATIAPPGPATVRFVPYDSSQRTVAIPTGQALPTGSSVLPLELGGYLLMSSPQAGPYSQILDDSGRVIAQPPVHPGAAYALADGGFAVIWMDDAAAPGAPSVLVQRHDALGLPVGVPTRAGPPAAPYRTLAASLVDTGVALAFETYDQVNGRRVYTQLLHEPDLSKQQQVRLCRAAAKELVGAEHRQHMSRCLRARIAG
jgi:hypothetical protein